MSDYERAAADLASSIRLGYEAEQADPNLSYDIPSDDEIKWLGAWLASEGWSRSADWRNSP